MLDAISNPSLNWRQRDRRRPMIWAIAWATTLHLGLAALTASASNASAPLVGVEQQIDDLITISAPDLLGPEPGGGSLTPGDAPRAEHMKTDEPSQVPLVARAKPKSEPPENPRPSEFLDETEPESAPDLEELVADEDDALSDFLKAKPARKILIESEEEASARASGAAANERRSRDYGIGDGAHGGPGGDGRGWGKVRKKFAFGGPTGAFKGEVCFIERGTEWLHQIPACPRAALFYTDSFNVAPRSFEQGFPGVTDRTEWFAIHFDGEFSVRAAGIYYFRLVSDDGSQLFIDERLVINNDGAHEPRTALGRVQLTAGQHKLRLLYFQGPRTQLALQLFVTPPYGNERIFGPET